MATRILIATIVGAVLAFCWSGVGWIGGFYSFGFKPMPAESTFATQLDAAVPADGAYYWPPMPETAGLSAQQAQLAKDAMLAQHEKGPLVLALVRKQGVDMGSPTVMVRGFLIELFATALLAAIVAIAAKFGARTADRIALVFVVAAFAMLSSHAVMWNFFHLPDLYSIALFIDGFGAWLLAGLACALIIKPTRA